MERSNCGPCFWNNEKENLISMYKNGISIRKIAEKYDCDYSTVLAWLKKFNVYEKKKRYNSMYTLNYKFFDDIKTEEQAYLLGFVLADGCVTDRSVGFYSKDIDIIEKIKKCLDYNGKEKCIKGCWILTITCKYMAKRLSDIGIPHNKSKYIDIKKILLSIDKNLIKHFVRGMFDGDGSIRIYRYNYFNGPTVHFGYTGTIDVVDFIKDFFGIHTKDQMEGNFIKTCRSSCKKDVLEYLGKIYDGATIYIDRKYKTYLEFMEICENLQRL